MGSEYAHPEVLVSTEWLEDHRKESNVRVVEVDVDTTQYETGHVEGAIAWNWQRELQDPNVRDIVKKEAFEALLSRSGIDPTTTVVLYGDDNNWFAAYAFWLLKLYGHRDVRLADGGRKKWIAEGRPLTTAKPKIAPTVYRAKAPNRSVRAFKQDVFRALGKKDRILIDVRSADEFTGKVLAPPGLPETAQRGGHIPGAVNIPWSKAVNEDGTFKAVDELATIYGEADGKDRIVYCRIGERSSHTWFVNRYLLGVRHVRNYDGSWTEYGNLVNAPIER